SYFGGATEMPIKNFNATYSKAVKASQLLDVAKNRKDLGLVSQLLIAGLGSAIGENEGGTKGAIIGGLTGLGLEQVGASGLASAGRSTIAQAVANSDKIIPGAAKLGLGTFNSQTSYSRGSSQ